MWDVRRVVALAGLALSGCQEVPPSGPPPGFDINVTGVRDGAILTGVATISVQSTGASLDAFDVFVGDRRVGRSVAPPFSVPLDTRAVPDARVRLRVVALMEATDVERSFDVTIDNTPPRLSLPAPADGVLYASGDVLALPVEVSDASGPPRVEVIVNGVAAQLSPPPIVATIPMASLGLSDAVLPRALTIDVRAVDAAGLGATWTGQRTLRSRVAWRASTLGEVWAPPAFGANGVAYFGARDGKLYAISPDGTPLGAPVVLGKEVLFTPALDATGGAERLLVSAGDTVLRVDAATGQISGSWAATTTLGTPPVLSGDAVYIGTFGGELAALDRASLAKRWSLTTPAPIESTPVVLATGGVVFGGDDRFVRAVDATGAERWRLETGGPVWSRPIAARAGGVLVGSHDGYLYRLGPAGEKRWEFDTRGQIWGGAAESASGAIYVGSTFGELVALSADGKPTWHKDVGGLAFATPAVAASGTVFVASTSGTVYALAPTGDVKWSHALGAEVVGGVVLSRDESRLLVGTKGRTMIALHTGERP